MQLWITTTFSQFIYLWLFVFDRWSGRVGSVWQRGTIWGEAHIILIWSEFVTFDIRTCQLCGSEWLSLREVLPAQIHVVWICQVSQVKEKYIAPTLIKMPLSHWQVCDSLLNIGPCTSVDMGEPAFLSVSFWDQSFVSEVVFIVWFIFCLLSSLQH